MFFSFVAKHSIIFLFPFFPGTLCDASVMPHAAAFHCSSDSVDPRNSVQRCVRLFIDLVMLVKALV